jgi:hypothetical protein
MVKRGTVMPAPKEVLLTTISNISTILETWEKKRLAAVAKYEHEKDKPKGFFSSGPNPKKLDKLISATGAVSREQVNLKKLNDALTTLTTELNSDNKIAISQIREVMMIHYINEYTYGRTKKEDSELLKAIQDVILKATENPADNFFLKNENLAIKKGIDHEHFDSRFLVCQYANVDPELPKVVAHIFDHIMSASLVKNDRNFEVYTAAMKALVRVGLPVAASEWNAVVSTHLGSDNTNPFLLTLESVLNAKEKFTEKSIQTTYNYLNGDMLKRDHPAVHAKIEEYLLSPAAKKAREASTAILENQSAPEAQADTSPTPEHKNMAAPPLLSQAIKERGTPTPTPPPEEQQPQGPKV